MDPLQRLLAALGAASRPTTPPFNPNAGAYTPVPTSSSVAVPPTPVASAPMLQTPPVAPVPTRRQQLEGEYADIAGSSAEKQNPWVQSLFLAMQAGQRIADPTNIAQAYDPKKPIQWLGNAKKEGELQRIQGELAPIYAQDQQRAGALKAEIDLENELAKLTKTRAEAANIGKVKPETREFGGRVYTTTDGGVTWKDAQGIVAPPMVKVRLNDNTEVELPAKDVYPQQRQDARSKDQIEAARVTADAGRETAQRKDAAERQGDYRKDLRSWQQERSKLINDGQELQNNAGVLEGQAQDLEAKGGAAEAAKLREEAAKLRSQGRAKIAQGNELAKPNESDYPTYTVPKTGRSGRIDKKRDPYGLFQ